MCGYKDREKQEGYHVRYMIARGRLQRPRTLRARTRTHAYTRARSLRIPLITLYPGRENLYKFVTNV